LRWEWVIPSGEEINATLDAAGQESVYLGPRLVSRAPAGERPHGHVVPVTPTSGDVRVRFFQSAQSAALFVNGGRVEPRADPSAAGPSAATSPFRGAPWWAVGFAVACGALPVVTRGGALWGALGFGAASLCLGVARAAARPVLARVALCALITALPWGVFALVVAPRGTFRLPRVASRPRPAPSLQVERDAPCDVDGVARCEAGDHRLLVCNERKWQPGIECAGPCTRAELGSDSCVGRAPRPGEPCLGGPKSRCSDAPQPRMLYRCAKGAYDSGERCERACVQDGSFGVCR
jgi:hypothetical protein